MPTWLLDAYWAMYSRLRAEETMDLVAALEAAGNRYMKPDARKTFMRDLQIRADGGQMKISAARPKSLAALGAVAGIKVSSQPSKGGVVLPAQVGRNATEPVPA